MKVNYSNGNSQATMESHLRSWEAPEVVVLEVEGTESGVGHGHEKTDQNYSGAEAS